MAVQPLHLQNLNDLRSYVHQTICDQNHLEPTVFEVTSRILIRGKRPCGVFFCVQGPRSVRLTAIWETDRNCILFYGSAGERTLKVQLVGAPSLVAAST